MACKLLLRICRQSALWRFCCCRTQNHCSMLHSWWRNQMEKFSALLALCEGNPPVTGGFPSQRPVTLSFDVFFDLHLNKRLSIQSRHRWLEAPSRSLWRHCNADPNDYTCSVPILRIQFRITFFQWNYYEKYELMHFMIALGTHPI